MRDFLIFAEDLNIGLQRIWLELLLDEWTGFVSYVFQIILAAFFFKIVFNWITRIGDFCLIGIRFASSFVEVTTKYIMF